MMTFNEQLQKDREKRVMVRRILMGICFLLMLAIAWITIVRCSKEPININGNPYADCKYNAPNPIFADVMISHNDFIIDDHTFSLDVDNMKAIEAITFSNGIFLDIIQTGCDEIIQEFNVHESKVGVLQPNPEIDPKGAAIEFLYGIGGMDKQYQIYNSVADAVVEMYDEILLDTYKELQPGFFIKIIPKTETAFTFIITQEPIAHSVVHRQ